MIKFKFKKAAKGRCDTAHQIGNLTVYGNEYWDKYIPLSHEQAIEILTRDLPAHTQLVISLNANGKGSIGMSAAGVFDESFGPTERREFNFKRRKLLAGDIEVNKDYRGSDVGRHVLRNEMEFFYLCNVRHFNIHPGHEAGGYSWARLGFLPHKKWLGFYEYTRRPVQERYAAIRPYLDKETAQVLDIAVKFKKPQDIWRIADSGPINTGLTDIFTALQYKQGQEMNNHELNIRYSFEIGADAKYTRQALKDIQDDIARDKNISLGRVLLAGTDWEGRVNMNNKEQMTRVANYVGGWKYIPGLG